MSGLKVVQIGKFYPPHRGGMESMVQSLCEGLATRGVEVEVLVASDGQRTLRRKEAGVSITESASFGCVKSLSLSPALPALLRKIPGDLHHLHVPNPLGDIALALAPRKPLVVTYHSDIVRQKLSSILLGPLTRSSLNRAERIVTTWPGQSEQSRTLAPFRDKCVTIPLGIDPAHFSSNEGASGLPEEILPAGRDYFLFVGRLVWYKGLEVLLAAVRLLPPEIAFVIVGKGPLAGWLRQSIADNNLGKRVIFIEDAPQDSIPPLYRNCRALVLPSVAPAEVFGVVQLEAFASGKPTINTLLPTGVPWVGQDGLSSITVPPGDAPALAEAISRLHNDKGLAEHLGRQGYDRMLREFTLEIMAKRYIDLYGELVHP
ncbi:MAG: glycosyltransferase [Planctomycetes bacterium]|nr:glycosyltransferase [Planctomycetota bacterium]